MPMPAPPIAVPTRETRAYKGLELRAGENDKLPKIVGYAAVFDKLSEPIGWEGFREQVRKGAFSKTLDRGDDVRAMVDHISSMVIGRRAAKTLALVQDDKGLAVEIEPANTTAGRDAVESIRRGDITGMSFGFKTITDQWEYSRDGDELTVKRTLIEVDLYDVSVVAFPAYPDTEVVTRSLKSRMGEYEAAAEADIRLRLRLAMAH